MSPGATDGQEAAAAVARAGQRLQVVRARDPHNRRITERIGRRLEANHFAEIVREALGARQDEKP